MYIDCVYGWYIQVYLLCIFVVYTVYCLCIWVVHTCILIVYLDALCMYIDCAYRCYVHIY